MKRSLRWPVARARNDLAVRRHAAEANERPTMTARGMVIIRIPGTGSKNRVAVSRRGTCAEPPVS